MRIPAARVASLLVSLVSACGTSQPDSAPKSDAKSEPETDAKSEPKRDAKPEPKPEATSEPKPSSPSGKPDIALTVHLEAPDTDFVEPIEFEATPAPDAQPLAGLRDWSCDDTGSAPPPCGWAKLCAELGRRWVKQIGVEEAADELGDAKYQEDCGDDGDVAYESSSGDFVDHAAVIRHHADVLADDHVAGILVQTKTGWHGLARIHESAIEGMSVRRTHEPRAAWQLELDDNPGKELVVLVTGIELDGDEARRSARLVVCRVSPEPSCRRLELGDAKTVEVRADGTFTVDGGEPKHFEALDRADQVLLLDAAKDGILD